MSFTAPLDAHFRSIVETVPVIVLVLNPDGRIEYVNPFMEELSGRALADVRGKDWFATFLPPSDHSKLRSLLAENLSGVPVQGNVNPIVTASGELRDIEWHSRPLRDADGRIVGVACVGKDVTEEWATRNAQRESEHRLRQIIDGMITFVGLYDLEGNLIEANEVPLKLAGLTRDDVIGRPLWDTYWWSYSAEARDQARDALARAARGEVVRGDFRVRLSEDQFIILDTIFGPVVGSGGAVESVVGSGVDVTDQHQVIRELAETQDQLLRAERLAQVASWSWDLDTNVLSVSPEMFRIHGRAPATPSQLSAEQMMAAVHPDDQPRLGIAIAEARESGTLVPIEARIVRDDGVVRIIRSHGERTGDDARVISGFLQDVTEQRAIEQADRRNSQVLLSMTEGVMFIDDKGIIRFTNPALDRMFGYERGELVGLHVTALNDANPEQNERIAKQIFDELAAKGVWEGEFRSRRKDGAPFFTSAHIAPLSQSGEVIWVSIQHDITHQKQAEERLRASLREKETLLREVHHRVKNNLQVISSLLHFQAKSVKDPEDLAAFEDGRKRLTAMILVHDQLYQTEHLSRVEFGQYVRSLVWALVASFEGSPRVHFDVEATTVDLPVEIALPAGMIICELVTNIFKYAFPEAATGTARVSVRAEDRVLLSVSDDGVGFDPDFDASAIDTFGWRLIRMLARQIGADVAATTMNGAHVEVSFPLPAAPT